MKQELSRRDILKLMSIAVAGLALSSCSAPLLEILTPTAQVISTNTLLPTKIPTPTSSPTSEPTAEIVDPIALKLEQNLNPIDSEVGTQEILTNVKTQILLDETLNDVTDGFKISPRTVEVFVAEVFYRIAKNKNRELTFEQFIEGANNGSLLITIRTQNLGPINIILNNSSGQETSNPQQVKDVVVAMVDGNDPKFEGLKIIHEEAMLMMRSDLHTDGKLLIYISPGYRGYTGWEFNQHTRDFNWAADLSELPAFLSTGKANKYIKQVINMLLDGGYSMHYLNK